MKIEIRPSELLILIAASVMSLIANLPESYVSNVIDRKMLLSTLTAMIVVAMFRYLQVMLLLAISILAIGANLPAELASRLGVSQVALIASLGALIAIALLNRVYKLLPMDKETPWIAVADWRQEMFAAISSGNQAAVHRLLVMNIDVNFTLNGMTPLHLAAEKGYPEIVRLLISHGADFRRKNAEGKTPLEIAQSKKKFFQTEEILGNVGRLYPASYGAEDRRVDSDIWQGQYT